MDGCAAAHAAARLTASRLPRLASPSLIQPDVRQILVQPGDRVAPGQVLLILEAMKMENEIKSPIDGVVASVSARIDAPVAAGDPLCVVDPWEVPFAEG